MQTKPSSLRVLFVAARYFPFVGGLETHVREVGQRLACAGVDVTILTTDVSGRLPKIEESDGLHIRRVRAWPANKDYYFAPEIYRSITCDRWDLIHCQGYHNLVPPLAMMAALRANIPFVLTFHSGGDTTSLRKALRWLQWMMLRPLLLHAQKLIAVSEFEARFFREQLRIPTEHFVIIPNGAKHLPDVSEPVKAAINDVNKGPLIVSIGRLERYKGHQRVIAALPKVLEQFPDAHVRIVGIGPYESTLKKMAKKLDVADRVDIKAVPPGDSTAMAALIARADLVTLLSEHEAQGLAVMEALTLKRPVLVASTTALQELADRCLAHAVPLKSTSEEIARAMVNQLRETSIPVNFELPSWDDCAAKLLELYEYVVRGMPCAY